METATTSSHFCTPIVPTVTINSSSNSIFDQNGKYDDTDDDDDNSVETLNLYQRYNNTPLNTFSVLFTNNYKELYAVLFARYAKTWSSFISTGRNFNVCNVCVKLNPTKSQLLNAYYQMMPFTQFSVIDAAVSTIMIINGFDLSLIKQIEPKDIIFHFYVNCCGIVKSKQQTCQTANDVIRALFKLSMEDLNKNDIRRLIMKFNKTTLSRVKRCECNKIRERCAAVLKTTVLEDYDKKPPVVSGRRRRLKTGVVKAQGHRMDEASNSINFKLQCYDKAIAANPVLLQEYEITPEQIGKKKKSSSNDDDGGNDDEDACGGGAGANIPLNINASLGWTMLRLVNTCKKCVDMTNPNKYTWYTWLESNLTTLITTGINVETALYKMLPNADPLDLQELSTHYTSINCAINRSRSVRIFEIFKTLENLKDSTYMDHVYRILFGAEDSTLCPLIYFAMSILILQSQSTDVNHWLYDVLHMHDLTIT